MNRLLGIAFPSISAVALRLVQLLVLVVLTRATHGATQAAIVAAFGILSSLAIVSDSGASNYLLTRCSRAITRSMYAKVVALQFSTSLLGAVVALVLVQFSIGSDLSGTIFPIVLGLAGAQVLDGVVRAARAPALVRGQDHLYGLFDLVLLAAKLPVVGIVGLTGTAYYLLFLPVASLAALLIVAVPIFRSLSSAVGERFSPLSVLEFGITGSLSALYSQAPMLVGSVALPLPQLALLAVAYRITQPLEIVPATLSSQLIPRVRARIAKIAQIWPMFVFLGVVVGLAVWLVRAQLVEILAIDLGDFAVLALALLAVPVKFGNYALVAFLLGRERVRARLGLTIVAGLLAIAASLLVSAGSAAAGLAAVTVGSELFLAAGALTLLFNAGERYKS